MQPSSSQNIGPNLNYDPSWTGPLNVKRSTTNAWVLIPFILALIHWARIAYYAFEKSTARNDILNNAVTLLGLEKWSIIATWMCIAFSSILLIVFFKVAARLTIYVISSVFLIVNLTFICYHAYNNIIGGKTATVDAIMLAMLVIYFLCFLLGCFINCPFIKKASEILRETIKAVVFFPSLMLCWLLLYALILVTTCFCAVVGAYLFKIDEKLQTPFDHVCNQLSNVFVCVWLTSFFFSFFRVVISGTYGTWYWTRNKYHVGSVIVGSLITPIVKLTQAFGLSHPKFADPSEHHRFSLLRALQPCYNRIGMLTDLAYVYTALHGQGYCESAKTTFSIWRRNYTKFVAFDTFIRELICMSFITIASISLYLYLGLKYTSCEIQSKYGILLAFLIFFLLINSIFLLMDVAMDTVLICGLEDFEVNGNSARPYFMTDNLKEIILENRMD